MKLFLDQKNRRFVKSAASNVALATLVLKRRDQVPIEIVYVENGVAITPPVGTQATVAIKAKFSDSNFLALAAPGTSILDLYTEPCEAAFSSNLASIPALLEVRWSAPGQALRTATLQVELQNSVILGDEGTPSRIPDGKASQAEAEAGTDHNKWMTPLRTAQAIQAQVSPAIAAANARIDEVVVSVDAERQARISADESLQSDLDAEQSARTSADSSIQSALTAEISARTAAISAESSRATAAEQSIAANLAQENLDRAAADAALSDRIDLLASNLGTESLDSIAEAAASINTLQAEVDGKAPAVHQHLAADITDFASAVVAVSPPVDWSSLTGKPQTFAPSAHTHPISEVVGLQTELDSVNARIDSALANIDPAAIDSIAEAVTVIHTERAERIAADAALQTSLSAETAARTSAISAETSRALAAESSLDQKISAETTARTSSDAALQTAVDGKAALVHTHTASQITDFASAVVASAPALAITTTVHVGDGTTARFSISGLASNNPSHVLVALNGVTQAPTLDYIVSLASGTITFDEPPASGTQIAATALGLRTVQPPIDPTLYLMASDVSGTTAYFGRLANSDLPAASALPESATTWRIRRIVTNASGQILATTTAVGSWANRTSLSYAP